MSAQDDGLGRAAALSAIAMVERQRVLRRVWRDVARVGLPDLDPDIFVAALTEVSRFRRRLGDDLADAEAAAETVRAAIEVAERRAAAAIPSERRSDDHGREN